MLRSWTWALATVTLILLTACTDPAVTKPAQFEFATVTGAEPGQLGVLSNEVTILGITAATTATVTAGGELWIDGEAAGASASVANGAKLIVSVDASPQFGAEVTVTVDVGGTKADFTVVTRQAVAVPNAFSFVPRGAAEPGERVTSAPVTLSGLEVPVTATVNGAGLPTLFVNGTEVAGSAEVEAGDTLAVSLTAGSQFDQAVTATVNVAGVTADFTVTTRSAAGVPDPFSFAAVGPVEPGAVVTSSAATLTGFDGPLAATVSGAGAPELLINGVPAAVPAQVEPGDTVAVRVTASSEFGALVTATATVGGVTADFTVTTRAADGTPDPFSFASVDQAEPGALVTSAAATLGGFDGPLVANVSGAGAPALLINGTVVATPTEVEPGDTVALRVSASAAFGGTVSAEVAIGGVTAAFEVATRAAVQPVVSLSTAPAGVAEAAPADALTLTWDVVSGDYETLTLTTVPASTATVVTGSQHTVTIPGATPQVQYVLTASDTRHALTGSDSLTIGVPMWVCQNPLDVITLVDPELLGNYYDTFGIDPSIPITCGDALSITDWNTGHHIGLPGSIASLVGMQHFRNLQTFSAHWNQIDDLTPLAGLTALEELNLDKNRITDLSPLTGHPSLRILEVWDNGPVRDLGTDGISDLSPLATIPTLEQLFLSENNISDLTPLAGLTSLTLIYLIANDIEDITPFANLTNLRVLRLNANRITDASVLTNMPALGWLELNYNLLQDPALVPLEGFENLWAVLVEGNYFTDFAPLLDNADFPAAGPVPGLPAHRQQPTAPTVHIAYNCLTEAEDIAAGLAFEAKGLVVDAAPRAVRDAAECAAFIDGLSDLEARQLQQDAIQTLRHQGRIR